MIDTHCHLSFSTFDHRLDQELGRAKSLGIEAFVIPGVSASSWGRQFEIAGKYPQCRISLGIHPFFVAKHDSREHISQLDDLLACRSENVVGVGETGLDRMRPDFELQENFFAAHVVLARKYQLPLIVHSVRAHSDVRRVLRSKGYARGVVHAFSGSYEEALSLVSLGLKLGVGCVITNPRASKTRDAISRVPLEALVLETDCPDMVPTGKQKGEGVPADLLDVFGALCEVRGEESGMLAEVLADNSRCLFGLESP